MGWEAGTRRLAGDTSICLKEGGIVNRIQHLASMRRNCKVTTPQQPDVCFSGKVWNRLTGLENKGLRPNSSPRSGG